MPDDYWEVIEPIWTSISIYDGPEVFLQQYRCVQPAVGLLFAAHWLYSEVCNGGFHQFFSNPTGILAPEAAAAFQAIGLPTCAVLIEEAMHFFGDPYPRGQEEREEKLDRLSGENRLDGDPFARLEEKFYDLVEEGRFDKAADEYARKNAA